MIETNNRFKTFLSQSGLSKMTVAQPLSAGRITILFSLESDCNAWVADEGNPRTRAALKMPRTTQVRRETTLIPNSHQAEMR